ncbi:cobalt ABC transporter permease [Leptotrichia sp. oral taxon 218]|uniref:CbiQ family ECF transporter T component n=1 Tax=Leptotrichia sp. oral taxon 218 TaxID=712361 RepID=UPI001B8C3CE4|nr:CbiQ family ECF transporter T component [Leptotrichia sp. oral taxon 218]QUB95544.1 cobalt ABC transporter permease [Leptotrichia sp. oral taxon 218]
MLIDKISYRSLLKEINPAIKIFFMVITLIFLIVTDKKEVFLFNFVLFNIIMLFFVKVKELLYLYVVPAFFIFTTALSLLWIKKDMITFLFRSFSSICVVYALICSTPISDFDYVFEKLKFPKIFRELFLLIYKFIFVLFDVKDKLLNAQNSRLGYVNYKNSLKSFSMLVAAIFRKTAYYNENSVKAVNSRLGKNFIFIHKKYKKVGKEIFFVIFVCLINLVMVVV